MNFFETLIKKGLEEDQVALDWTSLHIKGNAVATIIAKENGTFYGEEVFKCAKEIFKLKIESFSNGQSFVKGSIIATIEGEAKTILHLERTILNLISYGSGIATATAKLVQINPNLRISPTRKILPFYREFAILAIIAGGGQPHRVNLASGILIKENHIKAYGGIKNAIDLTRKSSPHGLKIEIEVENLEEYQQAISAGAEIIMLDHFSEKDTLKAIELKPKHVSLEVSGNMNEEKLRTIPNGIDIVSFGFLTHSVMSSDFSLKLEHMKN